MLHSISIVFLTFICSHSSSLSTNIFFVFFFCLVRFLSSCLEQFFSAHRRRHQMSDRATPDQPFRRSFRHPVRAHSSVNVSLSHSTSFFYSLVSKLAALSECSASSAPECGRHAAPDRGLKGRKFVIIFYFYVALEFDRIFNFFMLLRMKLIR